MQTQNSPIERSTDTRWWFVRASKQPNTFYRLTRRGCGPISCECAWAQKRARSTQSLKVCRHVLAVIAGAALEARPVMRRPVELTIRGEGFGFQAPEAA